MIPYLTVYSNTEAPYREWSPSYVILGMWEGNTFITPWVPYHLWQRAQPEAERLMAGWDQSKKGSQTFSVCRWHQDMCDAVVLCLRAAGFQVKVVYPPIEEDHCRLFTLTRR